MAAASAAAVDVVNITAAADADAAVDSAADVTRLIWIILLCCCCGGGGFGGGGGFCCLIHLSLQGPDCLRIQSGVLPQQPFGRYSEKLRDFPAVFSLQAMTCAHSVQIIVFSLFSVYLINQGITDSGRNIASPFLPLATLYKAYPSMTESVLLTGQH